MREGSPTVGLGAIIRDESGFVLGAMAKPVLVCFSPFVTECLALREGLIFAANSGLQAQMIETDALEVVNSLQKIDPLAPDLLIIEYISLLLGELSGGSCCAIPQLANDLARQALALNKERFLLEKIFKCISNVSFKQFDSISIILSVISKNVIS